MLDPASFFLPLSFAFQPSALSTSSSLLPPLPFPFFLSFSLFHSFSSTSSPASSTRDPPIVFHDAIQLRYDTVSFCFPSTSAATPPLIPLPASANLAKNYIVDFEGNTGIYRSIIRGRGILLASWERRRFDGERTPAECVVNWPRRQVLHGDATRWNSRLDEPPCH